MMSPPSTIPLANYSKWPDAPAEEEPMVLPVVEAVKWTRQISSLAPEIMCMIFHEGRNSASGPWNTERRLPFEVLVSHVSPLWRSIALADPFLWTTIRVAPATPFSRIHAYLAHSRAFPLSITLQTHPKAHGSWDATACMALLAPHVRRWRSLDVSARTRADLSALLATLRPLAAPRLEDLNVHCARDDPAADPRVHLSDRTPIFGGGAPTLARVHLVGIGLDSLSVPLSAVTKVSMMNDGQPETPDSTLISWDEFHESLSGGRSLLSMRLMGQLFRHAQTNAAVLELPSLAHLELPLCANGASARLLSRLSAPLLRSLHLCTSDHDEADDEFRTLFDSHYMKPWSQDFLSLTNLTIDCADIHEQNTFAQMSCAFPAVDTIEFGGTISQSTTLFLDLVAKAGGRGTDLNSCFPNLHTIAMRQWMNIEVAPLRHMLEARIAAQRPIATLLLSPTTIAQIEPAELLWLRDHVTIEELKV